MFIGFQVLAIRYVNETVSVYILSWGIDVV